MSMQDRMAAAGQRVQKLKATVAAKPATPAKPRLRVHAGGLVTEAMIRRALGLPSPMERWLEAKAEQHAAGDRCPHCNGTGRYRFHTDAGRNEKCYRCHGKGKLDTKDMAFLARRLRGGEPLCWIVTAPAA